MTKKRQREHESALDLYSLRMTLEEVAASPSSVLAGCWEASAGNETSYQMAGAS